MPKLITDEYINLNYNGTEEYALCLYCEKLNSTKAMNFYERSSFTYWVCKNCDD